MFMMNDVVVSPPAQLNRPKFPITQLDYELPRELIAQHPTERRDEARMLIVTRDCGVLLDSAVLNLRECLQPGDLLVLNDTKVLPARFAAQRTTGGRVSGLFIAEESPGHWRVMLEGSRRFRVGESLIAPALDDSAHVIITLTAYDGGGSWTIAIDPTPLGLPANAGANDILQQIGVAPLPPYIQRKRSSRTHNVEDRERYQTVYAKHSGAVAAPTAGLHLTTELLEALDRRGVGIAYVTLHVGLGTFKPIEVADLSQHVMHVERFHVPEETTSAIRECRGRHGRVVAVGTTSVRVLETAAVGDRLVKAGSGETSIFIYPPYDFQVVDAIMTNFHLPRSTLLALVMAFAGVEQTRRAYEHAIADRYRFYSYGDAMLIDRLMSNKNSIRSQG